MKPLVSVAIVTRNRKGHVISAIESVFRQSYRPIEVVMVDSASEDGTAEDVNSLWGDIKVIRLHRNMGCPEGRNIAIANCRGGIVFSLDDDATLGVNTIELCVKRFEEEAKLGIIGCLEPRGTSLGTKEKYTYLFPGCAFAAKREIFEKAGYFPSDFFRQAEEGDLAIRVIDAGYSILYYPEAAVYHKDLLADKHDRQFMFYGARNEIYTVARLYPVLLAPIFIVWKIFIWNWAGIRKGALRFTLAGCMAALFKLPWLISQRNPVSYITIWSLFKLKFGL